MTKTCIVRAGAVPSPVQGIVGGVPFSYAVGANFTPSDAVLNVLDHAQIPYERVYTKSGSADGTITITGNGTRIPVTVGGVVQYFATNTPVTVSASQRAALDNAGIAYSVNYADLGLVALTLDVASIAEDASVGATVGAIVGNISGSTLELTVTGNDTFALSAGSIITNAALDFETTPSYSITVRETNDAYTGSPKSTALTITVTDVLFGPELVTNGNFTAATGWTVAGAKPPAIAAGKLTADVTGTGTCTRAITVPAGSYTLVFTIDSISTGSVTVAVGNASGTARTTAGSFTQSLTVASGTTIVITCASTDAVIDNVSVKLNI